MIMVVTYLVLFGNTAASIITTALADPYPILKEKHFWILGISVLLTPLFFKRQMKDLTCVSIGLVLAFLVFLATIVY
jgi:amino acid permease